MLILPRPFAKDHRWRNVQLLRGRDVALALKAKFILGSKPYSYLIDGFFRTVFFSYLLYEATDIQKVTQSTLGV